VLGAVKNPGDFELKVASTVKAAIEAAGGFAENADRKSAALVREGLESVSVDLEKIFSGEIPDVPLAAGDTLIIKPAAVRATGKVKNPGGYDLKQGMTVLQLLAAAGGPIEGADLEASYVEREGKSLPVNLKALQEGSDLSGNIRLQPGDVLNVPERIVTILGEVEKPGQYALVPGRTDRLQDLLKMAGGPTRHADLKKVSITRVQGGARPKLTVDATQLDPDNNPTLQRGDTVSVPSLAPSGRSKRPSISQIYQIVLIAYYLSVIFRD